MRLDMQSKVDPVLVAGGVFEVGSRLDPSSAECGERLGHEPRCAVGTSEDVGLDRREVGPGAPDRRERLLRGDPPAAWIAEADAVATRGQLLDRAERPTTPIRFGDCWRRQE